LRITLAKSVSLKYQSGGTDVISGIKDSDTRAFNNLHSDGGRVVRGGFGSYRVVYPSSYDMTISTSEGTHIIYLARDLRTALGIKNLTTRIRYLIEETMPKTVEVDELTSKRGTKYYRISEDELTSWAERVRKLEYLEKSPEYWDMKDEQKKARQEQIKDWLVRKTIRKSAMSNSLDVGMINDLIDKLRLEKPDWTDIRLDDQGNETIVYSPEFLDEIEKKAQI